MPATTRRSPEPVTEPVTAPVSDDADQLRALVSAMLSGTYKEEFYLWDVASLCRAKPEFARQLLALIDRYHRLGQMSAAQHQKIKDKIDQTVASRAAPLSRNRASDSTDARARATTTAPLPTDEPAAASAPAQAPATAQEPPATAPAQAAAAPAQPTAVPVQPVAEADTAAQPRAQTSAQPPPAAVPPATPAQGADADADTAENLAAAAVAATAATRPVRPPVWTAAAVPPAPEETQITAVELLAAAQRMESVAAAAARSWAQGAPQPQTAAPRRAQSPTQGPAQTTRQSTTQSAAPSTPVIAPGTVLCNRYELQALLGRGGMGAVYRALDRYRASLGLPDGCVALKIVTAQPQGAANVLALVREFHNAQQLSHPSVINVYEIDHEGDASFYTMELLDGERLSQLLERTGGPLSAPYALSIIRDIGAAIAHAHSRGVVHGDLKPHNIFITYGGQVRVLDFGGLSHSPPEPWIADPDSPRRGHSYRTATPAYASCEQLEGRRAEPRDDIYALACIAYELLTGRHPFDCKSSTEARAQRLRPSRPPRVSAECWRALRHGLAWERAARPTQIEPWLDQLGVAAAAERLPPTHQLTAAPPRRSGIGSAITAIVVLLALGVGVFALELHGNVDWRASLAAANGLAQSTWRQWRTRADDVLSTGGAAAGAAPVNADLAPAPGAAPAPSTAAEASVSGATAPAGESPALAPTEGSQNRTAHARGHRIPRAAAAAAGSGATTRDEADAAAAPADTLGAAPDGTRSAAAGAAVDRAAAGGAEAATEPTATDGADAAATAADQGAAAAIGVRFAAPSYRVADTAPAARVVIRRTGNARDDVRFVWWTVEDSAKAEIDYAPLGVRTEDIPSGADDVTIYIPIISNPLRHQTARFYVALGAPGTSAQPVVPSERASVTIERGG